MKVSIGPLGILALIFITLKLCGTIAWSWWWVLSPIWLPFAGVAAFFIVVGILGGILSALK